MATTRPRDHRAMAARPPTRAAAPSSAPLRPSTWSLGHLVTSLLMMATTWFEDLSAATPPRPSTWFRDSSAATPPWPHLRIVPLLVDKVVGDIFILKRNTLKCGKLWELVYISNKVLTPRNVNLKWVIESSCSNESSYLGGHP
jgi:hypothetical protein